MQRHSSGGDNGYYCLGKSYYLRQCSILYLILLPLRKFWNTAAHIMPTAIIAPQYFEGNVEYGSIAQVYHKAKYYL